MSEPSGPLEAGEYARHGRFVRRLALRLAADEAAAEDLEQETWLAALQTPPGHSANLRSWFARVVRNKFVQRVRSESRRRAREEGRASEDQAADTAEIVERMEQHQLVVRAVLELPEPYRAVLVRRFSAEEDVAAIAAHLGLPEPTVRTRLRRGLEKLRERLRGELGGTPAAFLIALRKLSVEPGSVPVPVRPVRPVQPPLPATPWTTLILPLAMKKTLLVVAALAAVALVWSTIDRGGAPPQAMEPATVDASVPPPVEPTDELASEPAAFASGARAEERTAVVAESAAPPPDDEAPEPVVADRAGSTGTVKLRIEDAWGHPIPRAKLTANQWRPVEDPATAVWWGDDDARAMGESDLNGIVHLRYPRTQSMGDVGTVTLGTVGFEVSHPEYITHTEQDLDVLAQEEAVIVLERGSFLIVSGWIGSPSNLVADVAAHVTNDVDIGRGDWVPIGDGRPSCSRIPPGAHGIYLSHRDAGGRRWYSDVVPFELGAGEQQELALELHAARRMVGRLDERVPRPVHDGQVELNLYVQGDARAVMLRTYREDVAPDGTFAFTDLPPGAGEIIGLCDGWVSARTQLADSNWIEPREEGEKRRWRRMWQLQQLDPAEHASEPYVLAMEPTADARITIEGPDGAPLAGAVVHAWPNVHWEIGYSEIFLERTWQATTDEDGVARLENLPGGDSVYLGVQTDAGYLLPRTRPDDDGSRDAKVELVAGETAETTIRMDPPE